MLSSEDRGQFECLDIKSKLPHKILTLDKIAYKSSDNECRMILPDLVEDAVTYIKEEVKDYHFDREVKEELRISMSQSSVHKTLVSRRYVFLQDFPMSHAALKPRYGCEIIQDNSCAVYIGVISEWKNVVIGLSRSCHRLILPSLLRLLTSKDSCVSDKTLKQCISKLMSFEKTHDQYALYSAMKALAKYNPRSSPAVNCHVLDQLHDKCSDESKDARVHLVLDYIVSSIELNLLHYPLVRRRSPEVSKLLAVDSPLLHRLIQDTKNGCLEGKSCDVKTLALLQRTVTAVGMSSHWFIDRLVSKLYQLYRCMCDVRDRQQLLVSIAQPRLRAKLVEQILSARCSSSYVHRSGNQCLTADSVRVMASLLPVWLQASSHSGAVGNTADQTEEFLSLVVTYVESNLHIHKRKSVTIGSNYVMFLAYLIH